MDDKLKFRASSCDFLRNLLCTPSGDDDRAALRGLCQSILSPLLRGQSEWRIHQFQDSGVCLRGKDRATHFRSTIDHGPRLAPGFRLKTHIWELVVFFTFRIWDGLPGAMA